MKTFILWLILEETESNDPVDQVLTDSLCVMDSKADGEKAFKLVTDLIYTKNRHLFGKLESRLD